MQLLEEDYLGGLGSRGSGKVQLTGIRVSIRIKGKTQAETLQEFVSVAKLVAGLSDLQTEIKKRINSQEA
jgi:CRISPR-associated protein Csm3